MLHHKGTKDTKVTSAQYDSANAMAEYLYIEVDENTKTLIQ
jgi:hypothetical protein